MRAESGTDSRSSGQGDLLRWTMISDLDIYRTANPMVQRHGDDAIAQAAVRADELMADGDEEGEQVWLRVIAAIK
jgi:hypothetical protein